MKSLVQMALDLFDPPAPASVAAPLVEAHPGPALPLSDALAPAQFAHPAANRSILLRHTRVAYHFKRAKRRTIGMVVGPDGLVVSAPRWVGLTEVEAALHEKGDWIVRKLGEMRERNQRMAQQHMVWREGSSLPFLGEPLVLVLDPEHQFHEAGARLQPRDPGNPADVAHRLCLGLPHHADAAQIRDAVQAWLMRQAKRIFTERLDHFAPRLQVQWQRLSLSSASTRWGTASADGAIRLNWRLVHFKMDVIDYVVAHELSHLRVMNHSPQFWETVGTVVPDYAQRRRMLKEDSLPRW
jgi:predicted metal-dependent hydrolase